MEISHINPDTLPRNPAFSQAVLAQGGKTLFIGGQHGIRSDGSLAGPDLASQTEQAYKNILAILAEVGASQRNVVKQSVYMVKGQNILDGFMASQKVWGNFPAAITVVTVESLGPPGSGVLVEIDAIAVV